MTLLALCRRFDAALAAGDFLLPGVRAAIAANRAPVLADATSRRAAPQAETAPAWVCADLADLLATGRR